MSPEIDHLPPYSLLVDPVTLFLREPRPEDYRVLAPSTPSQQERIMEDELSLIDARLSPTFASAGTERGDVRLDFRTEAIRYFSTWPDDHRELIDELYDRIRTQDDGKRRVTVGVAVASHHEPEENIRRTLSFYDRQPKDRFSMLFFCNRTADQTTIVAPDSISDMAADMGISAVVGAVAFGNPQKIGTIKKITYDLATYKHFKEQVEDPLIVMIDIDSSLQQTGYLPALIAPFDDPGVDAVAGRIDREHAVLARNPLLHVALRMEHAIVALQKASCRDGQYVRVTSGNNTAMRNSAYAAIGGWYHAERGGDIRMSMAIQRARGSNRTIVPGTEETDIITSPRRELLAVTRGLAPNEVRLLTPADDALLRDPALMSTTSSDVNLETLTYFTNRVVGEFEEFNHFGMGAPVYRAALESLGMTVRMGLDGRLVVTDDTLLQSSLRAFREQVAG